MSLLKFKSITRSQKVVKILLFSFAMFFTGMYVYSNWSELQGLDWNIQWCYLALAVLILWITLGLSVEFWRAVLVVFGVKLTYIQAWRIFHQPLLGKYIPGKLWTVLGLAYFANDEGVSYQIGGAAAALYQVAALPGFSLAFLVTVPFWRPIPPKFQIVASVVAALIVVIGMHPKILFPVLNFVLRKMGRPNIEVTINLFSFFGLFVIFNVVICLLYGVAFGVFVHSLTPLILGELPVLIGGFCLALLLSLISVFVPAGIGVREGTLLAILSQYFSPELAVIASIGSRLWFTAAEAGFVGVSWVLLRIIRD